MCLTYVIKRKITLVGDACSRPPIIVRFQDLHSGDIRGAMGDITSYHERAQLSPFFLNSCGLIVFRPFFGLPFLSPL
jgi:hypothetical protein